MGRLERFKEKRIRRNRAISAAVLFFLILFTGLTVVDYMTNFLINGDKGIAFARLNKKKDSVEIVILDRKIYINTKYINRDMEVLKDKLRKLF